jgi:hypothetical protein
LIMREVIYMATFLSDFGRESWYFNGLIVLASRKHGLRACLAGVGPKSWISPTNVLPPDCGEP